MAAEKVEDIPIHQIEHADAGQYQGDGVYADQSIQKQRDQILDGTEYARKLERRYMRRLDMIILPTISSLYFFEYLDRGNVAVSILLGIEQTPPEG